MDKETLELVLNLEVELVNDENFVKTGVITHIFGDTVAFLTRGRTIYLTFDRIKEIRPLGRHRHG